MSTITILAAALAVLSLLSFGLMAYDKRCAKAGKRRVPEKVLFLSAACFGALGGVPGMPRCRHETKDGCHPLGFHEIRCLTDGIFDDCFLPCGRHIGRPDTVKSRPRSGHSRI